MKRPYIMGIVPWIGICTIGIIGTEIIINALLKTES